MSEDDQRTLSKARQAGTTALRKTKDALEVTYGKALRNRIEEYADLSSVVLAAHEDRLALLEERVTGTERNVAGTSRTSLYVAWVALLVALVALALVLVRT